MAGRRVEAMNLTIGGDLPVHRLGFGAMRLTGRPAGLDRSTAIRIAPRAGDVRLDGIGLYQLQRSEPAVPLADQIGALRRLQDEGKVRHVGLSEVTVEQLRAAEEITPIASVQNRYNYVDRASESVLEYCAQRG